MRPVGFGIIACSGVARRRLLPALVALPALARLVRVGSRDPARAAAFAREFGAAQAGDYEAVLADPEVEAVYISTPPLQHEEWVEKAIAAGKHVLCEKPALGNFLAARRCVDRARVAGVRLMEGYMFRHHPQQELVRSLVTSGRIGEPRYLHAEFTYPRPPAGDIRLDPQLGGGVRQDSAGYLVAAGLLQLGPEVDRVFSQSEADGTTGLDRGFSVWLRWPSGAVAQGFAGYGLQYRARYSLLGTAGRIEVERAFSVATTAATTVLVQTGDAEERVTVPASDQFGRMLERFCRALRAGGPDGQWEMELLRQHAVMDAVDRSRHEGRVVSLTDYTL